MVFPFVFDVFYELVSRYLVGFDYGIDWVGLCFFNGDDFDTGLNEGSTGVYFCNGKLPVVS